jgi:hypothetical protein
MRRPSFALPTCRPETQNLTVMKNSVAVIALALSLVSLGFQAHKAKPTARFDRFIVPANLSEYDYRIMQANQHMIRESIDMRNGMGVPFVKRITDDHQRLIVWVLVEEDHLPTGYDERKKALLYKAIDVSSTVASEFDLPSEQYVDAVSVEFMSIGRLVKDDKKPYAEYVKGELMLH